MVRRNTKRVGMLDVKVLWVQNYLPMLQFTKQERDQHLAAEPTLMTRCTKPAGGRRGMLACLQSTNLQRGMLQNLHHSIRIASE